MCIVIAQNQSYMGMSHVTGLFYDFPAHHAGWNQRVSSAGQRAPTSPKKSIHSVNILQQAGKYLYFWSRYSVRTVSCRLLQLQSPACVF
jgi:hypothetical protein